MKGGGGTKKSRTEIKLNLGQKFLKPQGNLRKQTEKRSWIC